MKIIVRVSGASASCGPTEIQDKSLSAARAEIVKVTGVTSAWRYLKGGEPIDFADEDGRQLAEIVADGVVEIAPLNLSAVDTSPAAQPAGGTAEATKPASAAPATAATEKPASATPAAGAPEKPASATPATASSAKPASAAPATATPEKPAPAAPAKPASATPAAAANKPRPNYTVTAPEVLSSSGMTLAQTDLRGSVSQHAGSTTGTTDVTAPAATAEAALRAWLSRGKLPAVVRKDEKLSLKPASALLCGLAPASPKLDVLSLLDSLRVQIINTDDTSVRAFETSTLRDLHSSTAFNLVFSASASGTYDGLTVSAEQTSRYSSSKERRAITKKRSVYISSTKRIIKASLSIPKELISVSADLEREFLNELRNIKTLASDETDQLNRIATLLSDKGAMVPLTYILGGMIDQREDHTSNEDLSIMESRTSSEFSRSVSVDAGKEASVKGEVGGGTSSKETAKDEQSTQVVNYGLHMSGGDPAKNRNPLQWVQSLNDPSLWDVIGFEDCLPVWEFFSPGARKVCRAYQARLMAYFASKLAAERQRSDLYASLLKTRDRFDQRITGSETFEVGIRDIVPTVKNIPAWRFHEDWVISGTVSEKKAMEFESDDVITWLKVFTCYSPPGTYRVTSGGYLGTSLAMSFDSESLRGMAWDVEIQIAKRSAITVGATYYADVVFESGLRGC